MDPPVERRPEPRRRAPKRIRFALERFLLRGLGHRLLLAASIVAGVALVAGILVTLLDPGFSEAGDGVWWAFLRLTDPGYLGDDEGLTRRTISTVVTVLGYVLFLGLFIAILTQWLNQLIADLRERLGALWNDRQVLLRSGSPLRLDHLERVALRQAAVLILPGADHAEHNPEAVDAQTVKTLMAISKHASNAGAVPPLAVAEIFDGRNAAVGQRAYAGDTEVPLDLPAFYLIDHRLIALVMVALLLAASEIGYRLVLLRPSAHAG